MTARGSTSVLATATLATAAAARLAGVLAATVMLLLPAGAGGGGATADRHPATTIGAVISTGAVPTGSVGSAVSTGTVAATATAPGFRVSGALPAATPARRGCPGPDVWCGALGFAALPAGPGATGAAGLLDLGGKIAGSSEAPDPFGVLGGIVNKAGADAWTGGMLAIWHAGLFILRIVLAFAELFLTPDLSPDGPGRDAYGYSLWLAMALVVLMMMVQLGVAAFKREGKSLARALVGAAQFLVVCSGWFAYCATVLAACAALTRAVMKALLGVNTWAGWDPLAGLDTQTVTDTVVATVLGVLGLVLWLAAIAHILVYLARAAALLILAATGPIAAAGLVSDVGRAWFWKSLRWFHAAALTPVLMVLVVGVGVQLSAGVAAHLADDAARSIGTALPAVMLILVSAVAPLGLFKLLAFVDPGTPSGSSFRQGMAIQGGLQGLLSGGTGGAGSTAAASADGNGRSAGEHSAEESTTARFTGASQVPASTLGPVGAGVATGLAAASGLGAKATSLVSDVSNQAGVGHHTYGPDFSGARAARANSNGRSHGHSGPGDLDDNDDGHDDTDTPGAGGDGTPAMPPPPTPLPPPTAPPSPGPDPGHPSPWPGPAAGAGGTAPGGAGGAAAAGSVPPVVA